MPSGARIAFPAAAPVGVAIAVKLVGERTRWGGAPARRVATSATNPLSPTLARRRARAWLSDPASLRGLQHEILQTPLGSYRACAT